MADRPVVSVLVPARDAEETIERTLTALAGQDLTDPYEVIVCDDGSTDATAEIAARFAPLVRLVTTATPGAAAARNAAVSVAQAPVLAFTDADCFPAPGWLAAGLRAMRTADVVQGRVLPDPRVDPGPFDRTLENRDGSPWFPTANLFLRRADVEAAGGFRQLSLDRDGTRLQPLGEDTVLAWSVLRGGARSAFAPEALVHHAVFPRGAIGFAWYRRHWRRLPEVVREVPELRREMLVARLFLERRTLLFDAAVAGLAAAAVTRRAAPAALALPYVRAIVREPRRWPGARPAQTSAARVAADVVAAAALVAGSVRARTPVL